MQKTRNEGRKNGREGQGPGKMETRYFVNATDLKIRVPSHVQIYAETIFQKSTQRPGTVDIATAEKEVSAWLNAIGIVECEAVRFLMDCGKIWINKETEL